MARWTSRRTRLALVVPTTLALLAPTAAVAEPTTTEEPVAAAAGWLANQLVDGERMETTFGGETYPDQGLTADAVMALSAAGVAAGHIDAATDWLETEVGSYTATAFDQVYAGSVAKLLLVAAITDRSPADFGGEDLVALLEDREQDSGRYTDDAQDQAGDPVDYSNVITQSLAVLALERTDATAPSDEAVTILAAQACPDGGFPQDFADEDFVAEDCQSQIDATAFAVQALLAAGESDPAGDAVDWLTDQQETHGGFVGTEGSANANSTGLAAAALAAAEETESAAMAQEFLASLQTEDCDLGAGSIRYDAADAGLPAQATAQALPGLAGVGLADVTATDASDDVPTFACPTFPDVAETSTHAGAISELARRGAIDGRVDGTFGPAADVTRGQLASIVADAAGLEAVEPADEDRFTDVDGTTHAGKIYALVEAGIVAGYPDDTFRPNAPVRRDQAAALLSRWLELAPVEEDQFTDIGGNTHRTDINALAEIDVALGAEGEYRPRRPIRRDQTASLVLRALRVSEHDVGETAAVSAAR